MFHKLKVKDRKRDLSLTVLLVAYLIIFIYFLYHGYLRLNYPYGLTAGEGTTLWFSRQLSEGRPIYTDINEEPKYSVNTYPPIFYIFTAILFPFFGKTLLAGRILSFISALLTGFFIFKIISKETKNKLIAITFSLAFFSTYHIFFWTFSHRPDFLGLLFSIIGIFSIQISLEKYKQSGKINKYFYLSILFFLLSFYTKQGYLAAPLSAFIYLLIKNRNLSYRFFLVLVISGFLILYILNVLTNGQFFIHVFLYNANLKISNAPVLFLYGFTVVSLMFFISSVQYILTKPIFLYSLYFIFSFLIMFVQFLRPGGASNFLLEPFAITCILTALLVANIKRRSLLLIVVVSLLFQIPLSISGAHSGSSFFENLMYINNGFMNNLESENKIENYVKTSNGNILVEYPDYALKNGFNTSLDVWKIYTLESTGVVSSEEIYNFCVKKRFSMIFHFDDLMSIKGIKKCIDDNYVLVESIPVNFYPSLRHDIGPDIIIERKIYRLRGSQ